MQPSAELLRLNVNPGLPNAQKLQELWMAVKNFLLRNQKKLCINDTSLHPRGFCSAGSKAMLLKTVSGFEFFKADLFRECLNAAWTIETFSGSFAAQNAAQDDRI